MKISKQPARKDGDTKEVVPNQPARLRVAADRQLVDLFFTGINDRDGKSAYNWYVQLSLEGVALIISAAAGRIYSEQPDARRNALSKSTIDLHRLLLCAAGFTPNDLNKP